MDKLVSGNERDFECCLSVFLGLNKEVLTIILQLCLRAYRPFQIQG